MKAAIQIKLIIIISIMIIINSSIATVDLHCSFIHSCTVRLRNLENGELLPLLLDGERGVRVEDDGASRWSPCWAPRSSEIPGASAPGAEQMVEMVYLSSTKEPRSYRGRRAGLQRSVAAGT